MPEGLVEKKGSATIEAPPNEWAALLGYDLLWKQQPEWVEM